MRQNTTLDVLIEQDETRMKVLATLTPDTETGDPEGWAILYRMPDDSPGGSLDDARPYSVVSATGHRAHFMGWRKVGRRRLGIGIGTPQRWHEEIVDYPHARVRLHFCKVFAWSGAFEMREGQTMAWETLPVRSRPVLPGTVPVLRWFAAERGHVGPTHAD